MFEERLGLLEVQMAGRVDMPVKEHPVADDRIRAQLKDLEDTVFKKTEIIKQKLEAQLGLVEAQIDKLKNEVKKNHEYMQGQWEVTSNKVVDFGEKLEKHLKEHGMRIKRINLSTKFINEFKVQGNTIEYIGM